MIPHGERWFERLDAKLKAKIADACVRASTSGALRGAERQREETADDLRKILMLEEGYHGNDSDDRVIKPTKS